MEHKKNVQNLDMQILTYLNGLCALLQSAQ